MDALTLLTQRKSNKKLTAPAPSQVQLEQMFQAALHALIMVNLNLIISW